MMTMKKFNHFHEEDPQEKTIRQNWTAPPKPEKAADPKAQQVRKSSSPRKRAASGHQKQKSQGKNPGNKFELPSRPDLAYREQSVEDYSDIFGDNDHDDLVFNQKLMKKACISRGIVVYCVPELTCIA
jgi:redox-sensitive bicupin YhaK (pirin superfamily)